MPEPAEGCRRTPATEASATDAAGPRLILASGSPRRLALLRQVGFDPEVLAADVDEAARPDEPADALVARLAAAKAEAVRERLATASLAHRGGAGGPEGGPGPCVLLGADTIVAHGARVLGKPGDRASFLEGLLALSDDWHRVVTAVTVLACDADAELVSRADVKVVTRVRFGPVDRAGALAYWASGEPRDKAGGYALQGLGARFVERIEGSPSNVVGLPLHECVRLLDAAGVRSSYPPEIDG